MKDDVPERGPARVAAAESQPPVIAGAIFRGIDRAFIAATRGLGRYLPDSLNPLARLGALANLMLLIACVTGAVLLFWYVPSHESAWQSVEAMHAQPFTAGLMRSLHRYSSDAAMLLVLLHGLQMLAQRRLAGPRWVAWVTGIAGLGFLWLVGWLGYWLVWDMRGQMVATGTAKMLDALPIFVDPVSTSFLTDTSVPSLLFFVVFFLHILLPLLLVIALWLHLARLSRANWMTRRGLTWLATGSLVVLSLLLPATSAPEAAMTTHPDHVTLDAWYLLPTLLTERLGGGALWALSIGIGLACVAMPWWFVRRTRLHVQRTATVAETTAETTTATAAATVPQAETRRAPIAVVDAGKCNACETCWKDCPFDAIAMMPREDGRRFKSVAVVDPDRCVGCGVCSGSCDSSAIGIPWLTQPSVRHRLDRWLQPQAAHHDEPQSLEHQPEIPAAAGNELVVFACARSAARDLVLDAASGRSEQLPGCRIAPMPCAGWLHALTVERALKRGAQGVVVVSCTPANCASREGASTARERLEGRREPAVDPKRVDMARILRIEADATESAALPERIAAFRRQLAGETVSAQADVAAAKGTSRLSVKGWALLALSVIVLAVLTWLPSDVPSPAPDRTEAELVVTFKMAAETVEACTVRTPEELAALPPHQRVARVCERARRGVTLKVSVDGKSVLDRTYEAGGAFGDGASRAVERIGLPPGEHDIAVAVGSEGSATPHTFQQRVALTTAKRAVVRFEAGAGFSLH